MTSRELVKRAIEFRTPPRMPIIIPTAGYSDAVGVSYEQFPVSEDCDEWGCKWVHTELNNMGQVKGHPLKDWEALEGYEFPDPTRNGRFESLEQQLRTIEKDMFVIIGSPFTLFERIHYLHGFTNTLQDLILEPRKIEYLADCVLEFQVGIIYEIKRRFYGEIDAFSMTDDWGTQKTTFISVEMFRRFFKPRYKKLFEAIHDAGMYAWMHSCGRINDFVCEFIDVGLDVINLQQPRLLGIEEIGGRFAGKICFLAPVDIQRTLPHGDKNEISAEAKSLIDYWGYRRWWLHSRGLRRW